MMGKYDTSDDGAAKTPFTDEFLAQARAVAESGVFGEGLILAGIPEPDKLVFPPLDELAERVKMLELALNYVSQQQFPQPAQTYGMLVALALKGKDKQTLKPLCPTCGKTYANQGVCRDYFHQPAPVRDLIG